MVLDQEMLSLKRFFATNELPLSDLWLESCVNWYREQRGNETYTEQELQSSVYEQWLLLDLRDVNVPTLPPNLNTQVKLILNGTFWLQVMYIVDISKPKYSQLQSIRNSSSTDSLTEQKNNIKRVLQLMLTDGVQEIEAFEYTPVACLNINMAPGVKIRLNGPVTIRRGRVFLEEKVIKVLGGEVEELLIGNAAENILAKILDLSLNPNPTIIEETFNEANKDILHDNTPQLQLQIQTNERRTETNRRYAETNQRAAESSANARAEESNMFEDIDFGNIDSFVVAQDEIKVESISSSFPQKKIIPIKNLITKTICQGLFKVKAKFKSIVEKLSVNNDEWVLKIAIEDETGELKVKLSNDLICGLIGLDPSTAMSFKKDIEEKDNRAVEIIMKAMVKLKEKVTSLDCVMDVQYKIDEDIPIIVQLSC